MRRDKPGVECPYCEAGLNRSFTYYMNAISRDLQDDEPAKKGKPTEAESESGFKTKDSKAWTPVRVLQLTSNTVSKIQGLAELNRRKNKKGEEEAYPVCNDKYGMDVNIKYDDKATAAANKYTVSGGDKTALDDVELEYLIWDLGDETLLKRLGQENEETARLEVKRLKASGVISEKKANDDDEDDEDDDDYDMSRKKRKNRDDEDDEPVKKKRKVDDYDDDEDEKPVKKKRKVDDYDEEDDDDEKPAKKKRSFDDEDDDEEEASKPKAKKRKVEEDEDDDDEKPVKKKRSFDDDEEEAS